jgi:alpha-glucosidase
MRRILLASALFFPAFAFAQNPDQTALTLSHLQKTAPLPNGLSATINGAALQITALRSDVIRIRIGPKGKLPEDASWAVLTAARTATSPVQPDSSRDVVGFHTDALRVSLSRRDATLRVTDLAGHLIQQDLRPV